MLVNTIVHAKTSTPDSGTDGRVSLSGSANSYFFSIGRERFDRLRGGLPLLPAISFCGLGGVLTARRIASSRRRAVSSGVRSVLIIGFLGRGAHL
jgi:hypothetical protein